MGLNEIGQDLLIRFEMCLPIKGGYTYGSTIDEGIASFLDLLPGNQMANLYPYKTIEGKRQVTNILGCDYEGYRLSDNGPMNVPSEIKGSDINPPYYSDDIKDFKYFNMGTPLNADMFVVRA